MGNKRISKKKKGMTQQAAAVKSAIPVQAAAKPLVQPDEANPIPEVRENADSNLNLPSESQAKSVNVKAAPPKKQAKKSAYRVKTHPVSRVKDKPPVQEPACLQTPQIMHILEEKKKKHYKLSIFAGMTAVVAVGSALFVFLLFYLSDSALLQNKPDVDLPNFQGLRAESVMKDPQYSKFNIEIAEIYTEDTQEGIVFDQTPKPPKKVKENAHILLRVSKGVHKVTVPDILGLTQDEAQEKMSEAQLSVLIKPQVDESVQEGIVVETDPEQGTVLKARDTVTVYVSRKEAAGNKTRVVPDCIGLSKKKASGLLSKRGLSVGATKEVPSDAPKGTVLEQYPWPGKTVKYGSGVTLTVSSGEPSIFPTE